MYAVIMAGGIGTRFWPVSRERAPKQFLNIVSDRSLIEQTYLRIAPIVKEENIFIVVNETHREITEKIFKNRHVQILTEPYSRNTAPCIGLAAVHIAMESRNAPIAALPADHFIAHDKAFQKILLVGAKAAEKEGICTIGITPTYPETGYGYIKRGIGHGLIDGHKIYKVDRFVEKPDIKDASLYIKSGEYLWNSGIFIFNVNTILEEIRHHLPSLHKGLKRIERAVGSNSYPKILKKVYEGLDSISMDHGIMEKTKSHIYMLPGNFDWSDIGSWKALYDVRKQDHNLMGNLINGEGLTLDTKNSLIYSQTKRLIATLGLKDILIVDTQDALLVADIKKSQEVRRVIEYLKKRAKKKWL